MKGVVRVLEYNWMTYRRTWRGTLFFTFVQPVLFLAGLGLGLGGFVDRSGTGALEGVRYVAFLAPGLLAAQAMQMASFESTYPILGSIVWRRTYHAMLATPLRVREVLAGQLGWIAFRLAVGSVAFLLVIMLFGAVQSPLAALAAPVAILTGLAFAAPIMAFSATLRTDEWFSAIFRFGITPLFLFSGTFFPIAQLPDVIEPIAYLTPLYHGVALARDLSLGRADLLAAVLHLAVLFAYFAAGVGAASITFRRRLVL